MDTFTTVVAAQGATAENESICPSLPLKERLIGFAACFVLGMILNVLSWASVFVGNYVSFGVMFTLGNISAIAGSLFLAGPTKQAKRMFTESRWITTAVYLVSLVATLLVAFLLHNGILVILCSLVQWMAMWWYFLSYIPGAQECIKGALAAKFG